MATQCAKQQGPPLARLDLATPCAASFGLSRRKKKLGFNGWWGGVMEGAPTNNGGRFGSSALCGIWKEEYLQTICRQWCSKMACCESIQSEDKHECNIGLANG